MSNKYKYQTLADKKNPREVEKNGPYYCDRKDAWLGKGYYFWENSYRLAEWWGRITHDNKYIICRSAFSHDDMLFNLVDNYEHIELLYAYRDNLASRNLVCTLPAIIEILKKTTSFGKDFIGVRMPGYHRTDFDDSFDVVKKYRYFYPKIQICFFRKEQFFRNNFKVVYPEEYIESDNAAI